MVTRVLDLHPPFEVGPALAMLAAGAIPGSEIADPIGARYTRLLRGLGPEPIEVTVDLRVDRILLRHERVEDGFLPVLVNRVRRWLNLDLEPAPLVARLGSDPVIGPLVTARPGLRVIGCPDGFEAAVMTVLGQQVSVAAARTFGARAVRALGSVVPGSALRAFPTADALAAVTPTELQAMIGVTHARARTLHSLAVAGRDRIGFEPAGDPAVLRRELLALPGIGPWTVDYLAVRALGERDAYPAADLVLRRALGVSTAAQAEVIAAGWRPYRAYALFHLWSAALGI